MCINGVGASVGLLGNDSNYDVSGELHVASGALQGSQERFLGGFRDLPEELGAFQVVT